MQSIRLSFLPGMLCFMCLGLLLVACQKEEVNPVSTTAGAVNATSTTVGKDATMSPSKVAQRPISDFLSNQTFATFWVSPDNYDLYYGVDYAGALDRALGLGLNTTFVGSITERQLGDGTAEVLVDIRSHNVATWMFLARKNERVFGMDPWSVQGGATPTLGDIHFKCTLRIQSPGAALLDINSAEGWASVTRITVEASAFGPLEAAAGLGPDGAPGHAWINQVGLLTKTNGKPGIDGFTAEVVKLQRVGQ